MRSGRICSVELPLSVLFQNSNFKNKPKFNDKNKKQYIDYTIFLSFSKSPHFPFQGKVGQLTVARGRECFVGPSTYAVYIYILVYAEH